MITNLFIALVALQHVFFLVLEMFLWKKPMGLKVFRMTPEDAEKTAVLAGNQGLYNGFLAAGLFWALLHPQPEVASQIAIFFLACVVVAGLYGGYTVRYRLTLIQSTPAAIALGLLFFFR